MVFEILNNIRQDWKEYIAIALIAIPTFHVGKVILDRSNLERSNYSAKGEVSGIHAFGFNDDYDSEIDRIEIAGLYGGVAGRFGYTIPVRRTIRESDKGFQNALNDLLIKPNN